jgi:hypothetical protein
MSPVKPEVQARIRNPSVVQCHGHAGQTVNIYTIEKILLTKGSKLDNLELSQIFEVDRRVVKALSSDPAQGMRLPRGARQNKTNKSASQPARIGLCHSFSVSGLALAEIATWYAAVERAWLRTTYMVDMSRATVPLWRGRLG